MTELQHCEQAGLLALWWPMCDGQMRRIAYIIEGAQIRKIQDHLNQAATQGGSTNCPCH